MQPTAHLRRAALRLMPDVRPAGRKTTQEESFSRITALDWPPAARGHHSCRRRKAAAPVLSEGSVRLANHRPTRSVGARPPVSRPRRRLAATGLRSAGRSERTTPEVATGMTPALARPRGRGPSTHTTNTRGSNLCWSRRPLAGSRRPAGSRAAVYHGATRSRLSTNVRPLPNTRF
jgi:hypothetical protein